MPAPDTHKALTIQVFRAEEEMAALLRALPNASEFIRRAVIAHAGCCCPLCRGTGVVPVALAAHFDEEVRRVRAVPPPEDDTRWCPRAARDQWWPGAADDTGAADAPGTECGGPGDGPSEADRPSVDCRKRSEAGSR